VDRDALEQLPSLPDDDDLVPSSVVKRENGGICDMTLWRWTYEPGSEARWIRHAHPPGSPEKRPPKHKRP
jgi:hypothetical protein